MPRTWVEEITKGLYVLRVDDARVKSFEAIWDVPEGATYNAYLLKTDGKTILFDGWKKSYEAEFIETLKGLTRIEDIDCIILHHTEPDHSGTLPKVLELNGYRAKVFGHPVAGRLVNGFYGIGDRMDFHAITDGEELEIGSKTLKFLHTTWLHWPDTICTYIKEDKILFTGDAFGGFSLPDSLFDDSDVDKYMHYVKKYIVNVVGHYKEHILKNIDKLAGIEIAMIAPLHGLIWKNDPYKIIEYYRDIAEGKAEKGKVLIVYSSMYGFVEGAIDHIIANLPGDSVKVFKFTDMEQDSISDALAEVPDSEVIILGASTYEAGAFPMMEFFARQLAHKTNYKKPVLMISSYGWGGAAARVIKNILSETDFEIKDVVEYRGRADEAILHEIDRSLGRLSG
ncbi:MAG: FprA family A-type flavoprotein [Candidatus Thermoplasmatota archaeon]|nr:FprA family A-type flavoprotein [Candidatus Thermoplasmatota archaeon]